MLAVPSLTPTPSPSIGTGIDLASPSLAGLIGLLGLGVAVVLPVIGFIRWLVGRNNKRREEALLVTSHYRLLGGLGLTYEFEISIHNATPHPLRIVEVNYWDGTDWRRALARSSSTGDPVLLPGHVGVARVPVMTTGSDFHDYYYLTFADSRNREWARPIDEPGLLGKYALRRLRHLHGTK